MAGEAITPSVTVNPLKIMSLKISPTLSLAISYTGDSVPLSLLTGAPTETPAAGKGLAAWVSTQTTYFTTHPWENEYTNTEASGTLKLAAWNGSRWVST